MEEPGRLQPMGSLGVGHDWATSLSRTGEGNGNPLQCSCLENPRDRGAWWAAVSGVAQSRTWLKRLSSSSNSTQFRTSKFFLPVSVLSRFSCVWLFVTLWTVACQVPLSMGFSRQEYQSWVPLSSPGDLPNPGKLASLLYPALTGRFFIASATWEAQYLVW